MNIFCFKEFTNSNSLKNYLNYNFKVNDIYIFTEKEVNISLTNNCTDKNIIDKFTKLPFTNNKIDLLKLIILYYQGGLVINNKIILKNVNFENLYLNSDLVVVNSNLCKNLFSGYIFAKKENSIIYKTLNEYLNNESISLSVFELLNKNISDIKNNNVLFLNKIIVNGISNIYFNKEIVAEHYFNLESLELLVSSNVNNSINLKNLTIGITFDVPNNIADFYLNGIRQNAIYFFELLKEMNYNVKLIIPNNKEDNMIQIINSIDFYNYEYICYKDLYTCNFNLIFAFCFYLEISERYVLKQNNVKLVSYQCGTKYIILSEKILFNQYQDKKIDEDYKFTNNNNSYHEIWIIPQNYKQNKSFLEIYEKSKCIMVPFIWSNNSINFVKKITNKSYNELLYKKKHNDIAIFEPNLDIIKWCLPCMLICEKSNNKYNNINHLYITNIHKDKKFNYNAFENMCKPLNIFKEKKMSVEGRFITLEFMSKYADIAVSHQWENPLNYLYLDLAWMGWPILHNASLCKDIGYYYEEFDYDSACEKLNDIIINHEQNSDYYLKKNREKIDCYLPTNKELQNKYRQLIENLFK